MDASAVKYYNTASSLVRFENKNTFLLFEKNATAYNNAGAVVVNSGANPSTFKFTNKSQAL
jgi:hypothetical protein